jgi:signal transduction histidine kinase
MSTIILLSGVLNLFLGLVVWLRKPKDRLNYGFAIFSLNTVVVILFDYLFRFYPDLIILRSSYAFTALIPITALIWILEICKINWEKISLLVKFFIFVPGVFLFIVTYIDGYIVEQVEYLTVLGYKGDLGPLFIIYALYLLLYICSFIYLIYNAQKKEVGIIKTQLRFIFLGVTSYSLAAIIFSIILPTYFNIFSFTLLDAPSLILFVGFTAYAILRLHFLNIKVVATELLVFTLSLFIFIRTLLSVGLEDVIINTSLFILVLIVGTFLIRSVIREIAQRERIEKLAEDLEKANEHLTELDRQKSEFVSFATHQLRAPLTAMKGYASLILDGDMGQLNKEVRDGIVRIFDSTNTLVSIVDDYLNVSRIELGTMKYAFETIDLKQLIEDTIAEIKPNIDASGLTFSFTAEVNGRDYRITADRDKLKQVIANLIDNAIKYTPQGSIWATLSHDKINHKFVFAVKDTGIGVAPEVLPRLFHKWSRTKNGAKTNIRGTGLGLYVAKQIVESHHGSIRVESEGEGKGSSFIVELEPFAKA